MRVALGFQPLLIGGKLVAQNSLLFLRLLRLPSPLLLFKLKLVTRLALLVLQLADQGLLGAQALCFKRFAMGVLLLRRVLLMLLLRCSVVGLRAALALRGQALLSPVLVLPGLVVVRFMLVEAFVLGLPGLVVGRFMLVGGLVVGVALELWLLRFLKLQSLLVLSLLQLQRALLVLRLLLKLKLLGVVLVLGRGLALDAILARRMVRVLTALGLGRLLVRALLLLLLLLLFLVRVILVLLVFNEDDLRLGGAGCS
jgi:hypothetical protein